MYWPKSGKPVARSLVEWAAGKIERLDDGAGFCPPQPGAARNDRMRNGKSEGAAHKGQTVGKQLGAKLGYEVFGAGRAASLIDQPGKVGGQIHSSIMP
jgi:hypothetical protein